jgi:hypothetical protein
MNRGLLALAIPVGILVFIFVVLFVFSRIMLAVPKSIAPLVALFTALAILGVSAYLASRPSSTPVARCRRRWPAARRRGRAPRPPVG